MAVWKVELEWLDNNGRVANHRLTIGAGASRADAVALALALADKMQDASDAALLSVTVGQEFKFTGALAPVPGADVSAYGLLFYTDGTGTASFRVPAFTRVCVEAVGPYAGIRATRATASVSGVLAALDGLVAGCLDPLGRPYGTTFVVAGYSERSL